MAKVTKTINPLHFEDLEPHRFEDLARQLVYDFREWTNLEATGTGGSDGGFDARGREVILNFEDMDEKDNILPENEERIWLIQCKREKSITPKKMEKHLQDIFSSQADPLYGLIFIAACNFSKKTRDTFISEIRKNTIKEFQLWGKAELEDQLFQPKNDHLLFAYFGISLGIRKRTLKSKIRYRIATKKKAQGILVEPFNNNVLVRDANDRYYPYTEEVPNYEKLAIPPWKVYTYEEQTHDGLVFLYYKHYAYLANDKKHFDYIKGINVIENFNNPWKSERKTNKNLIAKWDDLPEENKAFVNVFKTIKYDRILAIDEDGDNIYKKPHFYVLYTPKDGPFEPFSTVEMINSRGNIVNTDIYEKNIISFFKKDK